MKVAPKPIKIYYKAMIALFSDPLNKNICLAVCGLVFVGFVFHVIRSVFFL